MLIIQGDQHGWYHATCDGVSGRCWCQCPLRAAYRAIEEAAFSRRMVTGAAALSGTTLPIGSGTVLSQGDLVYWDGSKITDTASGNDRADTVTEDAASEGSR